MEQRSESFSNSTEPRKLSLLIVEDSFLTRRLLRKFLENKYRIFEAGEAEEALDILKTSHINLAILDINLGQDKKDGIALAADIKANYNIPFIYLTAYSTENITTQALVTQPASYLTKPFKEVDLGISIEIALQQPKHNSSIKSNSIIIKDEDYFREISIETIDYFEAEGNYLLVCCKDKMYKCRSTIKNMIETLPVEIFAQTHRSYIINRNSITKFNSKFLIVGEKEIPIAAKYCKDFQKKSDTVY